MASIWFMETMGALALIALIWAGVKLYRAEHSF